MSLRRDLPGNDDSTRIVSVRRTHPAKQRVAAFVSRIEEMMGQGGTKAVVNGAKVESYIENYPPKNRDLVLKFCENGGADQAVEESYSPRRARSMLQPIGCAV